MSSRSFRQTFKNAMLAAVAALLVALSACSSKEPSASESLRKIQLRLQTPVAAFGFEEGSGTAITDASGNGHNTALSGQTRVAGKYGDGLEFSGNFLSVPDSSLLDVTTGMTLSAWVLHTIIRTAKSPIKYALKRPLKPF